jgi:hypothetical protein
MEADTRTKLTPSDEIATVFEDVTPELFAVAAEIHEFGHSAIPCDLQNTTESSDIPCTFHRLRQGLRSLLAR